MSHVDWNEERDEKAIEPSIVSAGEVLIRPAGPGDLDGIEALYRVVADQTQGLARCCDEISRSYVIEFMQHSRERGIELVAECGGAVIGELHTYKSGLRVFDHVMGNLTVAVHPALHGQGVGRRLFAAMFRAVEEQFPEIERVELVVRESNQNAIKLYESLKFAIEGRMVGRIRSAQGGVEADLPMAWHRSMIVTVSGMPD